MKTILVRIVLGAFSFALVSCSRREPVAGDSGDDALATVTSAQLLAKVRAQNAKAVLVNAWATWCGSCRNELPMLQRLADSFGPRDVRVLLVSVDEPEKQTEVRKFLADNAIRLTSYMAAPPLAKFKAGLHPRWPGMLPASFLFDGTGKLRYFWGGEAFESEVVPVVEGLLAGRPIDGESRFDVAPEGPAKH